MSFDKSFVEQQVVALQQARRELVERVLKHDGAIEILTALLAHSAAPTEPAKETATDDNQSVPND